jgi:hypothetical protein
MNTPFYRQVPKTLKENLKFREGLIRYGSQGPSYAYDLKCACSRDILFWINAFLWIYEARPGESSEAGAGGRLLPFITYPFQDETFADLDTCYGRRDVHIEKARDMGATYMVETFALHKWQFKPWQSMLFVSRNESLVDSRDNPDAMFPKLRMLLRWQPTWLTPTLSKNDDANLHLFNPETNSVIDGASTTSNTGVGGRRTMMLFDEFALVEDAGQMFSATRDVSKNRVFVSTPRGENQFFKIKKTNAHQISLHWSKHPTKSRGLYRVTNGKVEIVDREYKFADDYKFVSSGAFFFDGKLRSPWYDSECERASHPREIRQELDIDYLGSTDQFFAADILLRLNQQLVRPPQLIGDINYNSTTLEDISFVPSELGRCLCWFQIDDTGKPIGLDGGIILGADVSQGTGASNSCLFGRCKRTGEQKFEFADPSVDPAEFGKLIVAVAKWLNNAHVIVEANGPGATALMAIRNAGYTNIYFRRDYERVGSVAKDVPGWWSSNNTKQLLLTNYQFALRNGSITERSKNLIAEMQQYIHHGGANPTIIHVGSSDDADPSGAGANHGDRVIAAALAHFRFNELRRTVLVDRKTQKTGETYGDVRRRMEKEMLEAESRYW